ncbi:MAG: hypothetical protein H6838_04675 [Planctomycetes bacterium]|nr:hypothetical protein [Planctomycetota bacterium]MCB9884761.1 hypothetical protein [Planctomycetota bacterium]
MKAKTLLALLATLSTALAQGPAPAADAAPVRIHIIGASVSAGFEDGPLFGAEKQGDSVPLQTVFRAWADDAGKVTTHSPMEMAVLFQKPVEVAEHELALLKKRKPDVVLAVDFLFWFAYGYVSGDELQARSLLLHKGLDMLTGIGKPVLIGDLPDMTGAARRMLSPRQIPSPEVLEKLNAEIRAAVAANPNLHLVPLADFVAASRGKGLVLPLAAGPLQTAPGALQQEDRLHATRLGVAYLSSVVQPHLVALMPEDHPLRARQWTLEQFIAAAGAEDELAALREKAAAGAGAAEAGKADAGKERR